MHICACGVNAFFVALCDVLAGRSTEGRSAKQRGMPDASGMGSFPYPPIQLLFYSIKVGKR